MIINMEELRISGLDELDADELEEAVPTDEVRIERPQSGDAADGAHHEPLTILAVILISSTAIRGLTAWLLKKRHRSKVELDVEIRRPDGTIEKKRVVIELSESSTEADIVREVGDKFGLDPGTVAKALAQIPG
jgi:hypothetical protein